MKRIPEADKAEADKARKLIDMVNAAATIHQFDATLADLNMWVTTVNRQKAITKAMNDTRSKPNPKLVEAIMRELVSAGGDPDLPFHELPPKARALLSRYQRVLIAANIM